MTRLHSRTNAAADRCETPHMVCRWTAEIVGINDGDEDYSIGDLIGRMTTGRFRHLPVVQQGKLIGIVSIGDVVKSRVEEIDQEAKTLREYIQNA